MLAISGQYDSLELIGTISWPEIFSKWKEMEAWQESWKAHWEERGFSSWDEWRAAYAAPLHPDTLEWFLYLIKEPPKVFPFCCGVPSRSWVDKAYGGETTKELKDILDIPVISGNPKILDIMKNFPDETMLTGIIYQNKIVIIEGMHRACAMASWNSQIRFKSTVHLALAKWEEQEIPVIGGNYKK
jgi:hypothetical protein